MKEYLIAIAFIVGFIALIFFAIIDGTSKKHWYSDKHDIQCEKILHNKANCKCYNRFLGKRNKKE